MTGARMEMEEVGGTERGAMPIFERGSLLTVVYAVKFPWAKAVFWSSCLDVAVVGVVVVVVVVEVLWSESSSSSS